jgi:undecaprenyl-phosphate 4-deoxy-4-formamido-L-arabinose transferase
MRHAINMVVGYSTAPLRMVTYLGFAVGLGGLALFTRLIWAYFTNATTVAGFTTITAMIAIFSSAQLIGTGVLGEYVGRIHAGGIGRPTYVIRDRTDRAEVAGEPGGPPGVPATAQTAAGPSAPGQPNAPARDRIRTGGSSVNV